MPATIPQAIAATMGFVSIIGLVLWRVAHLKTVDDAPDQLANCERPSPYLSEEIGRLLHPEREEI